MSSYSAQLREEQQAVSRAYGRLDDLRAQARARLDTVRAAGSHGSPTQRTERDSFATMYEDRLTQLRAVEDRLVFGRLDDVHGAHRYIGRIGLSNENHEPILTDWRADAARPFYEATPSNHGDIVMRRHITLSFREVVGVEDEVLDVHSDQVGQASSDGTLTGEGALLASLNAKRTGKSRYMTMGFMADGLFQSEEEIDNSPWISGSRPRVGDIKYKDLNGDGAITYDQDRAYLGRGQRPQFNGSVNLNASWKGLEFDILFVGAAVCDVSLTGTYYNWNEDNTIFTRPFKAGANSPRYLVEKAWTPENPNAEYPRLSLNPPNTNNSYASSFWYRDGKYLRLKSVHLGYTLPKNWTNKLRIQKVKVYIEGNNLCTWSGLPEGVDPEWPGVTNGYYPQQRTVVGGLEVSF